MLSKDLDESLIEKPVMIETNEYESDEISKRERDTFGFYITNHPVSKYKALYDKAINLNEIYNYFDKYVEIVIYVNRINTTRTKTNKDMGFIAGSDEYGEIDVIVFPDNYDLLNNVSKGDILYITGKIEKRMSKYQLVLGNLKKL